MTILYVVKVAVIQILMSMSTIEDVTYYHINFKINTNIYIDYLELLYGN